MTISVVAAELSFGVGVANEHSYPGERHDRHLVCPNGSHCVGRGPCT